MSKLANMIDIQSDESARLVDCWRELSRHFEISEGVSSVFASLQEVFPLASLCVVQIHPLQNRLDIAARFPLLANAADSLVPLDCPPPELEDLQQWITRQEIAMRDSCPSCIINLLARLALPANRELLLLPLALDGAALGFVLLQMKPRAKITDRQQQFAYAVMPAFAAALHREQEYKKLHIEKEAAERDKQALLHKLGRKDFGDRIIGVETTLKPVIPQLEYAGNGDHSLFILAETGTGKELFLREIHRRSKRHGGPVFRVNCGSIPRQMMAGQFLGSLLDGPQPTVHPGWIEKANMGTLLLDNVEALPLDLQAEIFNVITTRSLTRLSDIQPISVDTRVIASSSQDLARWVKDGLFHRDLWRCLSFQQIHLLPLRDRIDDIPDLARYFAERSAIRFGLPVQIPTNEDLSLLAAYHWPGNIRELASVMDRAALLGNGKRLDVKIALGVDFPGSLGAGTKLPTLDEMIVRHIKKGLELTHGRIEGEQGVAALLGINPHTLRARMRKLGINWNHYKQRGQKGQ
jgi:hydrogenase-4 transcriptional activator